MIAWITKKYVRGGQAKKGIKNVFSIRVRNFLYSIPVQKHFFLHILKEHIEFSGIMKFNIKFY